MKIKRLLLVDCQLKNNINNQTYSKHLLTKSMNKVSLHRSACEIVFDPGLRLRPFEFVIQRGTPRESNNS